MVTGTHRVIESGSVAPYRFPIEADLLLSTVHDDVFAKLVAQQVNRLAQRLPSMSVVGFGPEQCKEGVSTMESAGCGYG